MYCVLNENPSHFIYDPHFDDEDMEIDVLHLACGDSFHPFRIALGRLRALLEGEL